MINKIISGGQSGADLGGLKAAKRLGIETGGWIPKGFRSLDGYHPEYRELYNLQESNSFNYAVRTLQNIKESDGTIRFALDFNSPGERCTKSGCLKHKKPFIDINPIEEMSPNVKFVQEWLELNQIKTLNIAGNSKQTADKINPSFNLESYVVYFLLKVLGE